MPPPPDRRTEATPEPPTLPGREEVGRYGNPSVRAAERQLAALEGTDDCVLFSTGMAAVTTTLLATLRSGQHLVLTSDCFRRTRDFAEGSLARFGVDSTVVEPGDLKALAAAIRPGKTRVVVTESPTNPFWHVADIAGIAALCRKQPDVALMVDATLATPLNQKTAALGADFVIHSATTYLGGQNDLLAGAVCGSAARMSEVRELRGLLGAMLDAQSAFALIRGLKTLEVRIRKQNETASKVAGWLDQQPRSKIAKVYYPGLPSHPDHALAAKQMTGFGGLLSFVVPGGVEGATRFVDACQLAIRATSLGGAETLIQLPASMSPGSQRNGDGGLVRLSVGLEDPEAIIADMARGVGAV